MILAIAELIMAAVMELERRGYRRPWRIRCHRDELIRTARALELAPVWGYELQAEKGLTRRQIVVTPGFRRPRKARITIEVSN